MIIGEISVIESETSGHFDPALKAIMQNLLPFGVVSFLVVGYFFQLKPVNQNFVLMKSNERSYRSFSVWLWEKF